MNVLRSGLAFVLLLPALASGQSLGVSAAARAVAARHPDRAAAEASVRRARAGVQEAGAAKKPALSVDASVTRYQLPMIVAPLHALALNDLPDFDRLLLQGNLAANYTLYDGGARSARLDRAEALVGAAEAGENGVRDALLAQGVRVYLRVRTTREVLRAQERRVAALVAERDRARQLFEAGRAARLVQIRAEAALSAAQAEATGTRADVDVAERELARLTGIPLAQITADSLRSVVLAAAELPAREQAVAAAAASNAELVRLRRQVAASEESRGEARALRKPRVNLGARYIEYASGDGHSQAEWQGGVIVSYPIFTGGVRAAANQRASAEIAAARAELGAAELRVADAVDRVISAFESTRARVVALRVGVLQAEEVARIERLALEAGSGVQSDFFTAEAELFRVRAALTEATYAQVLARVELARVLGEISPEWIDRNLEPGS